MSWVDKIRKINNRRVGRLFGTREYIFTFSFRKIFQHGLCQLHLYSEKKKDHINHSLDLSFDKNNKNRKSYEGIKSNLKMASGLNTEHISKKGALFRNDVCEYL